ncbi:MAG: PIG-L deacetylase family protein [Candidatus Puniceispirillaceae bacterium]
MRILAMGAHPDDLEIFCYGLLAACKDRGDELHLAVATDGAAGEVAGQDNTLAERRAAETKLALSLLAAPVLLGLPDGVLSGTAGGRQVVYDHITNVAPDLILTHAPEDYHTDHRALSSWVTELAGFNCPVLYADTLMGVGFVPDYYVDITNWQAEKRAAILAHTSQMPERFADGAALLNRFRAAQCNAPEGHYAEAYRSAARFPFSDIRAMIPPPPPYRPYYVSGAEGFL